MRVNKFFQCVAATLFLIFAAFAGNLYAWDDVGHKITGYIAWQQMNPTARDRVIKILRAAPEDSHLSALFLVYGQRSEEMKRLDYFMLVPTWADIVRDRSFPIRYEKYHKGDWHYTSVFWRQVDGKAELIADKKPDGQAIEKLAEMEKTLRDPAATDQDKAIALAWLLHVGGDIHQPLHTSSRVTEREPNGDIGGNTFLLTPEGTPRDKQVNLHWFWDSIVWRNVPFEDGLCDSDYARHVAEMFMMRHGIDAASPKLKLGDYRGWQQEAFQYAQTVVFSPDLKRFEMPSEEYRQRAFDLSAKQLTMAGYRLGKTLNDVFGK